MSYYTEQYLGAQGFLTCISHQGRHEKSVSAVDTRHAQKNTRRHTVSMLRMFFKRR